MCYIMLRKGTDAKAFETKITRFLDNYNKEQTPNDYVRLGIATLWRYLSSFQF